MEAEQAQAIQNVINGVLQTIGVIAPLAALGTFGFTEFAKKVGLSSRWAGIFTFVFGFLISILVMGIVTKTYFTGLSILIGILVGFGTAGAYSGIKAVSMTEEKKIKKAQELLKDKNII